MRSESVPLLLDWLVFGFVMLTEFVFDELIYVLFNAPTIPQKVASWLHSLFVKILVEIWYYI